MHTLLLHFVHTCNIFAFFSPLPLSLLPLLTVHLGDPASLVLLPLEICVLCTGGVPLQSGEPCADRNCRGEHTTTVHSVHLIIILHVLLSKTLPPARSAHPCALGVSQPPPFALQWDLALCPRVGVFGVFILIFILSKKKNGAISISINVNVFWICCHEKC